MKTPLLCLLFSLSCITFFSFFISCEPPAKNDYRDAFTGNYGGREYSDFYMIAQPNQYDTIVKTVAVEKALQDSMILILGDEVQISAEGYYTGAHLVATGHSFQLLIRNDSLVYTYTNGGIGSGTIYTFIGTRQ